MIYTDNTLFIESYPDSHSIYDALDNEQKQVGEQENKLHDIFVLFIEACDSAPREDAIDKAVYVISHGGRPLPKEKITFDYYYFIEKIYDDLHGDIKLIKTFVARLYGLSLGEIHEKYPEITKQGHKYRIDKILDDHPEYMYLMKNWHYLNHDTETAIDEDLVLDSKVLYNAYIRY